MTHPMNDIARQARQGSVAAIIQILNEKLAKTGVRTRAVLENGVLQLLCEAAKPEQLEQSTVVEGVRQILESLAPRNIRRVRINSRIVREQQLLWLEEISREPEKQLLWYQDITLARPNFFKRLLEDIRNRNSESAPFPLVANSQFSSRYKRETNLFWQGTLVGGISLMFFLVLGVALANSLGWPIFKVVLQAQPKTTPDPFAYAVRLAEGASNDGKKAQSAADWLKIAAKWQQASDLMATVPPNDPRYKTAQHRAALYRQNSKATQLKAEKMRSPLN
ncbi:MAG: hypothetical protein N3E45_00480 [Oscillatoriaceae bacterium SKW80]|nr:hypothetical protein [Oscillatoriaceae bacterium SKYG93]MCX8119304.1 hypothetical protein [Oscillatoriaceae bacterium SKW80]MDW8454771.1 hypothetical protein [Oscillatoriaceae cyanobacterium SKYGB_i_bin93]HIK28448.1 hypothetical protein [Oscillatoriaceae cyanobacterium M7585_C2015_266]